MAMKTQGTPIMDNRVHGPLIPSQSSTVAHGGRDWRYLRPISSFGAKHGPDAPAGAKHVEGLGETVIVDDPSVDGEDAHQQDDVTTSKHHVEHLRRGSVHVCVKMVRLCSM